MTTDKLETGGPAFPLTVETCGSGVSIHGMSLRTYAATHLGVPQSEHEFINDMIRESQRNELAKAAMREILASNTDTNPNDLLKAIQRGSFAYADAMLAEQGKKCHE